MMVLCDTWNNGDISLVRDNGDLEKTLQSIKAKALVLPSKTDLFFTVCTQQICSDAGLLRHSSSRRIMHTNIHILVTVTRNLWSLIQFGDIWVSQIPFLGIFNSNQVGNCSGRWIGQNRWWFRSKRDTEILRVVKLESLTGSYVYKPQWE